MTWREGRRNRPSRRWLARLRRRIPEAAEHVAAVKVPAMHEESRRCPRVARGLARQAARESWCRCPRLLVGPMDASHEGEHVARRPAFGSRRSDVVATRFCRRAKTLDTAWRTGRPSLSRRYRSIWVHAPLPSAASTSFMPPHVADATLHWSMSFLSADRHALAVRRHRYRGPDWSWCAVDVGPTLTIHPQRSAYTRTWRVSVESFW